MKLPLIPHDKANHFIYGFAIFVFLNLVLNEWISLAVVCLFAFGKEIFDEWKYNGFDIYDAIYTIAPALILTLKQIYL